MSQVLSIITNIFHDLWSLIDPILQNLDPSLFQNVILGMLALLVPVGIGILSFFLQERSKGNIESNLELFILLKTVLKADKIVFFSFVGLLLLSFYNISIFYKILAILFFGFYIIWILSVPFKNIWKWFLQNTKDFSITFLKKLDVIKDQNTVLSSWQAFWLGDGHKENERDFTKIFISHIDDAIKHREVELAIQLSQTYVNNIEKRDRFSIGYEILPRVLEWNEKLWTEEKLWLKSYDTEKRIQNFISQKHFPTFRSWALKIYKKTNSKRGRFCNWHYFGGEFFKAIITVLLKDGLGSYQLFSAFKKHVDKSIEKLNKINDEKEKQKYNLYITGLFKSFCPTFFNEINSVSYNYEIWEHNFPAEWKVLMANTKSIIPSVILREFLQWARDRIFKKENEENFDKDLTEVINGIFPNVHSSLFTAFLMLFFSTEVKYAIEKEPNFYIIGISVSWTGSVEESKEDMDKRLAQMMNAKAESQKEETINIVLNPIFFSRRWDKLKITLNDSNKDEWEKADNAKRESMLKTARNENLEKIQAEIESNEIKKICKEDERKELYRKNLLELVKLLLEKNINN